MTYFPAKNGQIDGTPFQYSNCVPATCVMGADRATVGAKRPATAAIRKASGDTSGGILFSVAARATEKVCGVKGTTRLGLTRAEVRALVKAGHALTIGISCAVTRYTAFRTNAYTGYHAVFANVYRESTNTYQVEDPGTTSAGYLDWPADLLYRAAEAFGGGRINVIVWPDTEGVTKVAVMTGKIRKTASTEAPIVGTIKLGKSYTALATVTGGSWKRKDGTTAYGWWRVPVGTGFGFIRGEALA